MEDKPALLILFLILVGAVIYMFCTVVVAYNTCQMMGEDILKCMLIGNGFSNTPHL